MAAMATDHSHGDNGHQEAVCPPEFLAMSSVAGLAVGMLFGILVACLYRKCSCQYREETRLEGGQPPCEYHYQCFPVNHGGRRPSDVSPVFSISPPCNCRGSAHPHSNPPSYMSDSHAYLRPSTNPSRLPHVNHHRLSASENGSGWPTPGSLARSHSDLDPNRLQGWRHPLSGSAQPLSPIASSSGVIASGVTRDRRRESRNSSLLTADDRRSREEEMVVMNEFVASGNEAHAVLENAPPLHSNFSLQGGGTNPGPSNSQRQQETPDATTPEPRCLNMVPYQSQKLHPCDVTPMPWAGPQCVTPTGQAGQECLNNLQENGHCKTETRKWIPYRSIRLPDSDVECPTDDQQCEIEHLKLDLFTSYPEDLRVIFQPTDLSRMITVREKKVVYDCKRLCSRGGQLRLDNMGISLCVPPGAIPHGQTSLVTLVLDWDLTDNPKMDKREALVSPVVYCGPHASKFDQPCLLKFRHCAFDKRCTQLMTSETDLFEDKDWMDLGVNDVNSQVTGSRSRGQDDPSCNDSQTGGTNVKVAVDECQVEISHFSLYTCILRSKYLHMKKWLQVAVFTHEMTPCLHHQLIRVYFLNKTPCALQWAIQNEAEHGYRLACPENVFLFEERGEDLLVKLSYLSDGWNLVSKRNGHKCDNAILFEQIWHGACPHVSMSFRKDSSACGKHIYDSMGPQESSPGNGFGTDSDSDDDELSITAIKEGILTAGKVQEEEPKNELDGSGTGSQEISLCLKLSQLRCDNVSTDIHILMYDSVTAINVVSSEEETHLKTLD